MNSSFMRYGIGRGVALGSDVALFVVLLHVGMPSVAAAICGYCFGIVIHWLISSRLVFAATAAPSGPARTRQKALFVGSALAGLLVTTIIMELASLVGLIPLMAKLGAIVVSFQFTYMLRRSFVFTA
jgi:putative flippase GtrA